MSRDAATLLVEFRAPGRRHRINENYRVIQKGGILILEMQELDAIGQTRWVQIPFKDVLTDNFEWSERWGDSWKACATRVDGRTSFLDTGKAYPHLPPLYHGIVECSSSRNDHAPDDEDQYSWVVRISKGAGFTGMVRHLVLAENGKQLDIAFGALVILALYEVSVGT